MSKNIYGLTDLTNEAVVEVIRRKFLLEANTNPNMYDPIDVQRCRSEDWQIERFLIEKGKPDEALGALIRAMKWKKSFGVHERAHHFFPKELFLIFGYEKFSRDRGGALCSWGVNRNYRKIPELSQLIKQFLVFQVERADREAGNKKIITIGDCNGVSYSNSDISLARFNSDVLPNYPQLFKLLINMDMPWVMMSIFKLVKSFLPKSITDKLLLIKREELTQNLDINEEELPVSFGGKRETVYDVIDDMLPLYQLKHLNLSDKQIDNFYKTYNFDKNENSI